MKTKDVNREKKSKRILGESRSTANTRLHRELLWMFLVETGKTKCYRCNEEMTRETFSIDHKLPWSSSENPEKYFWDLENIDFSHSICNSATPRGRRTEQRHGTLLEYQHYGCRCVLCVEANRKYQRDNPRPSREGQRQRTIQARQIRKSTHGTMHMYKYEKCRCELCVKVAREYWKQYRKTRSKSSIK